MLESYWNAHHMVYADKRLVVSGSEGLCSIETDTEAAGEARASGERDTVDVGHFQVGLGQRSAHDTRLGSMSVVRTKSRKYRPSCAGVRAARPWAVCRPALGVNGSVARRHWTRRAATRQQ